MERTQTSLRSRQAVCSRLGPRVNVQHPERQLLPASLSSHLLKTLTINSTSTSPSHERAPYPRKSANRESMILSRVGFRARSPVPFSAAIAAGRFISSARLVGHPQRRLLIIRSGYPAGSLRPSTPTPSCPTAGPSPPFRSLAPPVTQTHRRLIRLARKNYIQLRAPAAPQTRHNRRNFRPLLPYFSLSLSLLVILIDILISLFCCVLYFLHLLLFLYFMILYSVFVIENS